MFIGNNTSLFAAIQDFEIKNYFNSLDNQIVSINTSQHQNKVVKGSVLFKVSLGSPYINSLMYHQGFTNDIGRSRVHHYSNLFDSTTEQLLQVSGQYNLVDSLKIISNFIDKAGNNFYGAIIRHNDTIINPLHPLIVPVLLANFDEFNNQQWNIILYFYTNRKEMDNQYKTHQADLETIKTQIDCIYNTITDNTQQTQESAITEVEFVDTTRCRVHIKENLTINEYIEKMSRPSLGDTSMLVAHQMMTNGITAPYYGTTLLNYAAGDRSLGGHISPFRSCNISYEGDQENTSRTSDLRYIKVCTGSKSSGTLEGIRTLIHANFDSPYTRYTILDGALAYADACINKAMQIYKLANILDTEVSIKEIEPVSLINDELMDRYKNDRVNLLKELHANCTKEEFIAILKAIKDKIDSQVN